MMSLLKQIEERRAYRAIGDQPIARDSLIRLAEAAHLAPSSANNQPWRIVTVVDPVRLEALKGTLSPGNYWAKRSPAISAFITSADWSMRASEGRDYAWFELGMAAMAYQLQAVEEGLIVHPIAGFDAAAAKSLLGLPEGATLVALIVLGHPGDPSYLSEKHLASERAPRVRKALEDVFAFDAWDDKLLPAQKDK
jgi:nitroreductase